MSRPGDFADPEREPTDEDLKELAREAFAHVAEANAESLRRLEAEIVELRVLALARLGRERGTPTS